MDGSSFFASLASSTKDSSVERISFDGTIDSFPIRGSEVSVTPSPGADRASKVETRTIVNYGWDFQYYSGQMVALHKAGTYIAYAITLASKKTGVVRVLHRRTEQRGLLDGMKGKIKDLAFAHCTDQIMVGVVDDFGNMFVFRIAKESEMEREKPLVTHLVLEINASNDDAADMHRLIWCPYLADDDDDDDGDAGNDGSSDDSSARLLVVTHGSVAEMWNIDTVVSEYGEGRHDSGSIRHGRLTISDHDDAIMDASFSPDGTALATASADGRVMFFQVYMVGRESPRCLHQWKPHEGKPVTSLFFLDNHRDHNPDEQFWRYAVTACQDNSELKLWSCEKWTCLQTINFVGDAGGPPMEIKTAIDLTASFMLLSDIHRNIVYVLHLQQDGEKEKARFVSVSEFVLPCPFLDMAILLAGVKKVSDKHTVGEEDSDEEDEQVEDPQGSSREATVISFVSLQPKSLQECRIVYEDAHIQGHGLAMDIKAEVKSEADIVSNIEQLQEAASKITLMSPDVFTSSAQPAAPKIKEEPASPISSPASCKQPAATVKPNSSILPPPAMASGGSSPSGEVQDILGDSEDQGGLTAEIVVTEENMDDDDDDDDDDDIAEDTEDEDVLEQMLESATANANLKFNMKAEAKMEPPPPQAMNSSGDPLAVKVKLEPADDDDSMEQQRHNKTWPPRQPAKHEPLSPIVAAGGGQQQPTVDSLMGRLSDMTALIQTQRAEMQVWREEMKELRREDAGRFKSLLDDSSAEAAEEMKKVVSTGMSQSINCAVANHLKSSLNNELRRIVPQMAQVTGQHVQQHLTKDVQSKVAKSETHMKDALQKLATSKATSDAVGNAVAHAVGPAVEAAFRDTFVGHIVPAFERAVQNLITQLASTLNKGLKDYEAQLKAHVVRSVAGQVEPIVGELKAATSALAAASAGKQNELEKRLLALIRTELRSLPATPINGSGHQQTPAIPTMAEIQATVNLKLSEGRLNEAFAAALSANNLGIVVDTCDMVNPNQIFNQHPCPLSQEVLLSLVQQLGHNLEEKTDLKHRFLEDAVMNLDQTNPTTKHHIPVVMTTLHHQLTRFAAINPNKKTKMLLMAIQSLKSAPSE